MSIDDKKSCSENFCQEYPLLCKHLDAVLEQNKTMNLTSIKDREAGKVLHIEDSLAALTEVQAAPEGLMADIGSGAGFPGIALAITSGRTTTLIEASKKKAAFLEGFITEHQLGRFLSVSALRTEELVSEQRDAFSVISARAVAILPSLVELAAPLMAQGGHFIALKGRRDNEELERGKLAAEKVGMKQLSIREYTLSQEEIHRCIVVYEKVEESSITLPRRPGMATKRPLA